MSIVTKPGDGQQDELRVRLHSPVDTQVRLTIATDAASWRSRLESDTQQMRQPCIVKGFTSDSCFVCHSDTDTHSAAAVNYYQVILIDVSPVTFTSMKWRDSPCRLLKPGRPCGPTSGVGRGARSNRAARCACLALWTPSTKGHDSVHGGYRYVLHSKE